MLNVAVLVVCLLVALISHQVNKGESKPNLLLEAVEKMAEEEVDSELGVPSGTTSNALKRID